METIPDVVLTDDVDTPSDAAAFFDLDRTLMSGSSTFYFGKAAYREGLVPLKRMMMHGSVALTYRAFGATEEQAATIKDRILETVKGLDVERLVHLAPAVIEDVLPRIKPEAQALVDYHREAGRDIYVLSSAPVEIIAELAKAMSITGGLGTQAEIVDGKFTGELAAPFCYGKGKSDAIKKLVSVRGYNLSKSYAYSDSASDLPMMQLVGHPVAVNPDRLLVAVAHQRGWPVVEFNRSQRRLAAAAGVGAAVGGAAVAGVMTGMRIGATRRERWLDQFQRR